MHQQTEAEKSSTPPRAERIMPPWGIPTATGGCRVDTRALSNETLILEVTQVYDQKLTRASTPLSRDSARALRDALNTFLDEQRSSPDEAS